MSANYDIHFHAGERKAVLARIRQSEGGRRLAHADPDDVIVGGVQEATATRRELLQECLGIDIDANVWFKLDKVRLRGLRRRRGGLRARRIALPRGRHAHGQLRRGVRAATGRTAGDAEDWTDALGA